MRGRCYTPCWFKPQDHLPPITAAGQQGSCQFWATCADIPPGFSKRRLQLFRSKRASSGHNSVSKAHNMEKKKGHPSLCVERRQSNGCAIGIINSKDRSKANVKSCPLTESIMAALRQVTCCECCADWPHHAWTASLESLPIATESQVSATRFQTKCAASNTEVELEACTGYSVSFM